MNTISISAKLLPLVKASLKFRKKILTLKVSNYHSRLQSLEKKYRMTTGRFLKEFEAGNLEDLQDFIEWEYLAESHKHLSQELQQINRLKL